MILIACHAIVAEGDERTDLLKSATAHWLPGVSPPGQLPLTPMGKIDSNLPARGTGARPDARVASLNAAYFDAGPKLNLTGNACTIFVRLRDSQGSWRQAFVAKRGSVEEMNVNFFASQYPGKPCPEVAFELRTDAGFGRASFLVDSIDRTAWHDLVARYDGQWIELFCDGRWMATSRHRGTLHENEEPLLIGAWTDAGQTLFQHTGEIEEVALWNRALNDADLACLVRRESIDRPEQKLAYRSPVHYRPEGLTLADTIPFYWKGDYHIFYLRAGEGGTPWGHVVSRDLVHWKELPDALPLGKRTEPDGENVFTGSVIEREGVFHIFYTGWNPRLKIREQVMHATSRDLIAWTKVPGDSFTADGVNYSLEQGPDFRDPFVFWNDADQTFWMLLCARRAGDQSPVTGLATSKDLISWQQRPPVAGGYRLTPECPDMFPIGNRWYLIVSPSENVTVYRTADTPAGPWSEEPYQALDTPILYAAKRMFDGRRHVLTGWLRDLEGDRDDGAFRWGGTQSIPREVYAGNDGELLTRPVPEVVAVFDKTVFRSKDPEKTLSDSKVTVLPSGELKLNGAATGSRVSWPAPDNYLLDATLRLRMDTECALVFRDGPGLESGYRLILRPAQGEVELRGDKFRYRRPVSLPTDHLITIRAFVLGTTIECFVNDAHALSCRAYERTGGRLGLQVAGAGVAVEDLVIKTTTADFEAAIPNGEK
ncbi:MAG: hypothetical protein NT069_01425 [Planctomycetota bacterium]|nr:hypothetical protein [Planctomycetota bacterium]